MCCLIKRSVRWQHGASFGRFQIKRPTSIFPFSEPAWNGAATKRSRHSKVISKKNNTIDTFMFLYFIPRASLYVEYRLWRIIYNVYRVRRESCRNVTCRDNPTSIDRLAHKYFVIGYMHTYIVLTNLFALIFVRIKITAERGNLIYYCNS